MADVRVVLVGGGTASGKSTIVRGFVEQTGALHIAHDRYYLDAPDPMRHDFDHPDALETVLLVAHVDALRQGRTVDLPRYGFPNHRRQPEVDRVVAHGLIVVEGILVLASSELVAAADLTVFVDAPADVRLERRIQRDMAQRGRDRESVLRQYEATVKPAHDRFVEPGKAEAGLLLDGEAPVTESIARLMAALRGV